jgi:ATPase subunit of ABC transporter with duplicated ATPase domains
MEAVRQNRLDAARSWAKAARRALAVALPLEAVMPRLPLSSGESLVVLQEVSAHLEGKPLFQNISLNIGRERVAVTGPNGAGKTSLLRIMTGDLRASVGSARQQLDRIGVIAQGALDWMSEESLLERLAWDSGVQSPQIAAELLLAHGFPLALAERPLSSLSPGERARAALVCLLQRRPAVELLVLDEPVHALDFAGAHALRQVLLAWPGGLLIASHDKEFLESLRMDHTIELHSC